VQVALAGSDLHRAAVTVFWKKEAILIQRGILFSGLQIRAEMGVLELSGFGILARRFLVFPLVCRDSPLFR
jgi:hypothetical protein